MNISVIVPTYNERDNIIALIESLARVLDGVGMAYQLVVVDDDSPDGTAEVLRRRYSQSDHLKVICRNGQRGLASAVKVGIEESSGDVVVLMDADFSHHPDDLPAMFQELAHSDLVNGSRYLSPGNFQGSLKARLFSTIINSFLRMILRLKTTDNTNGFLAIRRAVLTRCGLESIFYGYGDFHFRLMYRAMLDGAVIKEVPVIYRPRQKGQAKTRFIRDGWGYVFSALRIRSGLERFDAADSAKSER